MIVVLLGIFVSLAENRVEATLVRTAGERAQRAADQIAGLLDGSRSREQITRLGADPVLKNFLKSRSDAARQAALADLRQFAGTSLRRIQLWDNAGALALELQEPGAPGSGDVERRLPRGAAPSVAGISPLQSDGDVVFSDTVAEIQDDTASPGASGTPLGFFRLRTTFVENPPGIFSRLVGKDAVVRVGNRAGGLWTDFVKVAVPENVDLAHPGVRRYRSTSGDLRLGAVSLVTATPWAVSVEFPFEGVLAPARNFRRDILAVALPFLLAAGVLALLLGARITRPLAAINAAAAAVATGDYSHRVGTGRRDEIGQLGRAFDAMAADVEATAAALRKSEAGYRALFAANPVPMWVYDVETLRFVDVNEMAVIHYGYSRDEFLAMTITEIRADSEAHAQTESVNHATELVPSGMWTHRKKDGTLIDVELSSHVLRLDGRRARVVLANDVTARVESQRALLESEARFRGMAENMPHVVWTARPSGQRDYFNHHWFDYTGLTIDATLGKGWLSCVHREDRDTLLERWRQAIESGGEQRAAFRLRRHDGVFRWHVGRAAPLKNDAGDIVMWVGTMTDIDDIRRAQEALTSLNEDLEQRVRVRTGELAAANRELEAFSYSVSHDLRAPLRHVQGYVEMLTEAAGDQLPDKSRRYLKTIREATAEMGELIDGLLSLSRIGKVQMSETRVALDTIVREAIDGLEMDTRDRNIEWHIDALPAVQGDPAMIKQVFANLIGNAVKYTSKRERAVIEIAMAGVEDGRTIVRIRDNGAGFDMRYAHKLFGVFQRLHGTHEFEGTGIGLATVRRIVARHGGRVWAEGEPDAGATFFVTLQPSQVES